MHELINRIHDILNNVVSKWVSNTADILAYLFKSASSQHHEVWALQFPVLHNFKDTLSPSETCFYDHINWSLSQA